MRPVVLFRPGRSGFTLTEIIVAAVILAVLAAGFFAVLTSSRYLVSRQKRRLTAYEQGQRILEFNRGYIRGDFWDAPFPGYALDAQAAWTPWANATVVNGVRYESRLFVVSTCNDCPRRVTVQVRWNETRI
ncbi:MAG: prepilin-type N-terminal cleavage/methylation domain-containing protein [Deltaproteobacteria bacterium]